MTSIIPRIVKQIRKNPGLKKVEVSKIEWLLIKRELRRMSFVRPDKRPTYKGPFADSDRQLWDANFRLWRDYTPIKILGIPVVYASDETTK